MTKPLMEQPADPLHEVRVCEGELRQALRNLNDALDNPTLQWGPSPPETAESALVNFAAEWIRRYKEET